jgi:hypothetical protein
VKLAVKTERLCVALDAMPLHITHAVPCIAAWGYANGDHTVTVPHGLKVVPPAPTGSEKYLVKCYAMPCNKLLLLKSQCGHGCIPI